MQQMFPDSGLHTRSTQMEMLVTVLPLQLIRMMRFTSRMMIRPMATSNMLRMSMELGKSQRSKARAM